MKLPPQQFERTRRLALHLTGIELADRHRELLGHRSRRAGIRDLEEFDHLLAAGEAGEATARARLIHLVTTCYTGFFRHPCQFELAARHLLRVAPQRGRARAWSAAAATGEEPWSLAMTLGELCGEADPPLSILATDINAGALDRARRGEFGEAAVAALTPAQRTRWLEPATRQTWRVIGRLQRWLEFRPLNLVAPPWPIEGPFDVIFCRNVLMYLEAGRRRLVLEHMARLLAPDGLLLLDPTEHPGRAECFFTAGGQSAYTRRHEPATNPDAAPRPARGLPRPTL